MSDKGGRSARGFSTRAIAAGSRAPRLQQTPTSVPIYQTATFAADGADELGQVLGDPRAGFAYSRISNPTTTALGDAFAELAGQAVIDALRLPELTASLGSVHTMVVHPPSTSHRQSGEAELLAAGITPGLLRVSVGLEDLEDLQADFAAALSTIAANGPSADRESVPALRGT